MRQVVEQEIATVKEEKASQLAISSIILICGKFVVFLSTIQKHKLNFLNQKNGKIRIALHNGTRNNSSY